VGKRLWETILAVGGTRPTALSFEAFRGRQPDLNFLLKNKGLITNDFHSPKKSFTHDG
jgi:oligopeptidase A